jgi:hypothetical protein
VLITYLRSSSYTCEDDCQQRYFLDYILGFSGPAGSAAIKGSIVHKVLEILALVKKAEQENKKYIIDNDVLKRINISDIQPIQYLVNQVFDFYATSNPHIVWKDKDKVDCRQWTNKALTMNGGIFDPRSRTIVQPEQEFDIEIPYDWAKYSYDIDGDKLEGRLHLKGTIDLLVEVDSNFYEIIDWKTGRKFNWGKGIVKTDKDLKTDPQLMLYHYATTLLYPDISDILVTINFINDGGPTTVAFTKKDIKKTEDMIKRKFERIRNTKVPRLNKGWKCTKFCHHGRTTFQDSHIEPQVEDRDNQVVEMGNIRTKCEQTKYMIEKKGLDWVMKNYTKQGYSVTHYKAPGAVE